MFKQSVVDELAIDTKGRLTSGHGMDRVLQKVVCGNYEVWTKGDGADFLERVVKYDPCHVYTKDQIAWYVGQNPRLRGKECIVSESFKDVYQNYQVTLLEDGYKVGEPVYTAGIELRPQDGYPAEANTRDWPGQEFTVTTSLTEMTKFNKHFYFFGRSDYFKIQLPPNEIRIYDIYYYYNNIILFLIFF